MPDGNLGEVVTPSRRKNMQANRRRDTKPEKILRALLHKNGFRYRVDMRLQFDGVWVRPDIVFTRRKVAVFVDGCFWHVCPEHGSKPRVNTEYWNPKLRKNQERDMRNNVVLEGAGWTVIRVWEHTPAVEALALVAEAVRSWTAAPKGVSPFPTKPKA